jgi:hypothetical protein
MEERASWALENSSDTGGSTTTMATVELAWPFSEPFDIFSMKFADLVAEATPFRKTNGVMRFV